MSGQPRRSSHAPFTGGSLAAARIATSGQPPSGSTFSPVEWQTLAGYWHPVAYAHEVSRGPVAATLLDEQLAIYRSSGGVVVAKDVCLHRGARLSLGRVDGEELECAYHGWRYGAGGRCVRIPQQPASRRIAPRVRLITFPAVERYGIIWTRLSELAMSAVPTLPRAEDEGYQWLSLGPFEWSTSAARQVENFLDVSHFSFVHRGTFGNPDAVEVDLAPMLFDGSPACYSYTYCYPFREEGTVKYYDLHYRVQLPFCASIESPYPDKGPGRSLALYNVSSPVSRQATRLFFVISRNFDLDQPPGRLLEYEARILNEDKPVVESQRPEELPLDLHEELHVQSDKPTLHYRRALRALLGDGLVT